MFKVSDKFKQIRDAISMSMSVRYEDQMSAIKKGEVFMTLRDGKTGEIQDQRHIDNTVTRDASILVARLFKNNAETGLHGGLCLAVGTGDTGWNPMAPPAPTKTQRALFAELTRKAFASSNFVDSLGNPTAIPTNVVDFVTTFTESEAVGPLVEMGILGGTISTNMSIRNPVSPPNGPYDSTVDLTQKETLCNYLTYKVQNKPETSTLGIIWRLTF
jgi:hypothetical protein